MGKTIIVSNRLPVRWTLKNEKLEMHVSEGGLATGLSSVHQQHDSIWVGWPGLEVSGNEQRMIEDRLRRQALVPVFLTEEQIKGFYEGFSNEILWPIFHYISTYSNYEPDYWEHYRQVNELFKDKILEHAGPEDTIWIHDYQLLLLPMMLREALPDTTISFFLHIPFPSQELFRLIPWRNELLRGMLGADLLGFQTYDDVRHFISSASRILGASQHTGRLEFEGRQVTVDSFPISIDADRFGDLAQNEEVQQRKAQIKARFKGQKIMLSVDRLDYSKGILQRLKAYEHLLEHRNFSKKTVLYMIVVPSRDNVPQYEALKKQIDQEVGRINAQFSVLDWQPIVYFYQSFPLPELVALYKAADVCLVTPMRDGMNLVCKEYVASRRDLSGVLVLSEMAGASHELVDALLVNPTNLSEMARTMETALTLPEEQMQHRMKSMQQVVRRFDIHYWANSFLQRLKDVKQEQQAQKTRRLNRELHDTIRVAYQEANRRLLLLDYDGTLVGFKNEIEEASPDEQLYQLLDALARDPRNDLVLISGRKREHLEAWFGTRAYHMVAEHGVWYKRAGADWVLRPGLSVHWQEEVNDLLVAFADRTPGAHVERKSHSIAWHYRKVQKDLGMIRSGELLESLRDYSAAFGLQILEGHQVIEVRNAEVNKGRAALEMIERERYDFILAIGDDRTDEDVFIVMPEYAFTIKVGSGNSNALTFVSSHLQVRPILQSLLEPFSLSDDEIAARNKKTR